MSFQEKYDSLFEDAWASVNENVARYRDVIIVHARLNTANNMRISSIHYDRGEISAKLVNGDFTMIWRDEIDLSFACALADAAELYKPV